ncbi:predicted protein [Uncinocarpus reesii 1704]|uniref:Peptidase S8/S53 domain-containing protein n=1 Tax=Uncinocarpus reesii (strain UAMH 1704) TaxID=336963 RepID=C4JFC3_UNCRE|nr:uncharacterized protein UREG_02345 [Uncinocarpus reesii 1704]EEP77496.1 predicted protein [Uncinocarpus reesii 1704]
MFGTSPPMSGASTVLSSTGPQTTLPKTGVSPTTAAPLSSGLIGPVVIVETTTATLPVVTSLTTLVTLGHTFTLRPPANTSPGQDIPVLVIVGTKTATLPGVLVKTTLVTFGSTFTIMPPASMGINLSSGSETSSVVSSFPPVPGETTMITRSQTMKDVPGVTTSDRRPSMATEEISKSTTTRSASLAFSSLTEKTRETMGRQASTLTSGTLLTTATTVSQPSEKPSATRSVTTSKTDRSKKVPPRTKLSDTPATTSKAEESKRILHPPSHQIHWQQLPRQGRAKRILHPPSHQIHQQQLPGKPKRILLSPSHQMRQQQHPRQTLARRTVCRRLLLGGLQTLLSLRLKLKSKSPSDWTTMAVYGPPPIQNIKLPPQIQFKGELPPWPRFTVGIDGVPTFPPKPNPTKCRTKAASLCSTTTSFVVSAVGNTLQTISSQVIPPTCVQVRGCLVTDATHTATATTTEECPTSTVTDAIITCSGSGMTACMTKTTIPRKGCSVTPVTTTVSCTPAPTGSRHRRNLCPLLEEYIVWPKDGKKIGETNAIHSEMQKVLHDKTKITVLKTKSLGVHVWRVLLEPDQVQRIRDIPNVAVVYPQCKSNCGDPFTSGPRLRYQKKYVDEFIDGDEGRTQLVFISNPEEEFHEKLLRESYVFNVSAVEDIPIYIVDTGAQLDNPVSDPPKKAEFLFAGPDYDGKEHKDDSGTPLGGFCSVTGPPCNPHGTAMLSVIAGYKLGVVKRIKPIIVRIPRRDESGGGSTPIDWLNGLGKILDAFPNDSEKTRAIVSLSWIYSPGLFEKSVRRAFDLKQIEQSDMEVAWMRWQTRMYELLTSLVRKGVFVVVGSGNDLIINGYPALFGAKPQAGKLHIPELMVVGALDPSNGQRWWKSGIDLPKGLPHIYAPGTGILAAEGNKTKWKNKEFYKSTQGTSEATAMTAALAAYFLSLHQVGRLPPDSKGNNPDMSPAGLKEYILNSGWVRYTDPHDGPILGIWNGVKPENVKSQGYCSYKPKGHIFRRQEEECVPGTSSVSRSSKRPTSTSTTSTKPTTRRDPPSTTVKPTTLTTSTRRPKSTPTEKPIQPLKLEKRQCFTSPSSDLGVVDKFAVKYVADEICTGLHLDEAKMSPGKKPIDLELNLYRVPYHMSISWKPGCETIVDSVSPAAPLAKADKGTPERDIECVELLYQNWLKCDNRGQGGYIDAGCLRYEFEVNWVSKIEIH